MNAQSAAKKRKKRKEDEVARGHGQWRLIVLAPSQLHQCVDIKKERSIVTRYILYALCGGFGDVGTIDDKCGNSLAGRK